MPRAETQLAGHSRNFVDANTLADLVIIAVTGLLQAFMQVHISVACALPAMETGAIYVDPTLAADGFLWRDLAVF